MMDSGGAILVVKLKRTDTTLDLSQKARVVSFIRHRVDLFIRTHIARATFERKLGALLPAGPPPFPSATLNHHRAATNVRSRPTNPCVAPRAQLMAKLQWCGPRLLTLMSSTLIAFSSFAGTHQTLDRRWTRYYGTYWALCVRSARNATSSS
jgi:hypothetical protein